MSAQRLSWSDFAARLRWLDGRPLADVVEPYRDRIFREALDTFSSDGRPAYNLILSGRAKKNWKSADLGLAALFALVNESPSGHDSECYLLANDKDQARDDLTLVKKLVSVNSVLQEWLVVKRDVIERRDGGGFLEVLPAGDVVGAHGKSYRLCAYDEIHGYRTWDVFEAMQPDPHRPDSQQWITSYASIYHRPGVPLFDLFSIGKAGTDPRMLFDWHAADFTTDPDRKDLPPEERANPSMGSWDDADYLEQQQRRLPSHKYRRLHLNLPGTPEGSAYSAEPVMDAVERSVKVRAPEPDVTYTAFVDMSGGSRDDAVLAIAHKDPEDRAILDLVQDQGQRAPFDPSAAVTRFVRTLREYGCSAVTGDKYAGETFKTQFESAGVTYHVSERTKHQIYEDLEPHLNASKVAFLDVPLIEQQALGLVWRGAKIDHPSGEHDDYINAAAGAVVLTLSKPAVQRRYGAWGRDEQTKQQQSPAAARARKLQRFRQVGPRGFTGAGQKQYAALLSEADVPEGDLSRDEMLMMRQQFARRIGGQL